jgi:hypothetical protein
MGLDLSHNCWHGSYPAFHRWRSRLAEVAKLPPLGLMKGFFARGNYADPFRDFARDYPNMAEEYYTCLPISWDALKPDILHVLLSHSDCNGIIAASDCGPLADRLEELLPLLPETPDPGHIGDWREKTQTFIDGLRLAASQNEDVDFH